MASCSIPVVMPPVSIDGVNYSDGGVLRNLPAWTIRDKCQRLIGINVSPVAHGDYSPSSIFDMAMRTYSLMAKSNQHLDMEMCDLSIVTQEITQYNVFNLKEVNKMFNAGYSQTRKALIEKGWWENPQNPE